MRMRSVILSSAAALLGLSVVSSTASAAPLVGKIAIANDNAGGVRIGSNYLDWYLPLGGGVGAFTVGDAGLGKADFAFLVGDTGTIKDLHNAVQPVAAPFVLGAPPAGFNANTNLLPGEGVVLQDFLRFSTAVPYGAPAGDIAFDLDFIAAGAFAANFPACATSVPAIGQTCTIPGTPFSLVNTSSTTSSASFVVAGFVRRISTGELSRFEGVYSTQFTVPYQSVLNSINTVGFIDNTYSATFEANIFAVPEPATLLTFGIGSVVAAHRARRRKKA